MKKEALEVLKNRRSIRKFTPEQITAEELGVVLEAGTYAPTAGGQQQPIIVAVQNKEYVEELDKINGKIMNGNEETHPYYGAPTIILVLAPTDGIAPVEDGSLVAGNLLNAAYSAGLGGCWIHRTKEMLETPEGQALLKKWKLPANMMGVASIALGYADCEQPEAAERKKDYIRVV